jgi:hypothetical protein
MRSKVLLLAAVALATLVLATPAVARPSVHGVVYPHSLSTAAMTTVACLALAVAVALVTVVVLASRPKSRTRAQDTAPEQLKAPRVKTAPRRRQAIV